MSTKSTNSKYDLGHRIAIIGVLVSLLGIIAGILSPEIRKQFLDSSRDTNSNTANTHNPQTHADERIVSNSQEVATIVGIWKHPNNSTTWEYFANGSLILTTDRGTFSGNYAVDDKKEITLTLPGIRGKVLSLSSQELRVHLHINSYSIWGNQTGEEEQVITFRRPFQPTFGLYFVCAVILIFTGGLGFLLGNASPMDKDTKLGCGCIGTAIFMVVLVVYYTPGAEWAGILLGNAGLGFYIGLAVRRMVVIT